MWWGNEQEYHFKVLFFLILKKVGQGLGQRPVSFVIWNGRFTIRQNEIA